MQLQVIAYLMTLACEQAHLVRYLGILAEPRSASQREEWDKEKCHPILLAGSLHSLASATKILARITHYVSLLAGYHDFVYL